MVGGGVIVLKVLSKGINMYGTCNSSCTVHAEADAINHLPPIPNNHHKLKKVNLIVIRTTKNGIIGMSKPCIKCIMDMLIIAPSRGYVIKDIYYSDEHGNIITTTLTRIVAEGNYHISKYYASQHCHPLKG